MIEITNLDKTFDKKGKSVHAVNNLSVSFGNGVTALVGENGAGKSTLFRLIADIINKDSGQIFIDGIDNTDEKAKANLFLLPDEPYAPLRYSPLEIAKFYSCFYDIDMEKFNSLLSKVSLPPDRKISTFSKGMRRQLFLLIAFSVRCKNILLDEAFDGLDPLILDLIGEEIVKMCADGDKTIVLSSHNMASVQRIADSIMILYKGNLSDKSEKSDMGKEFVKYQLISKEIIKPEVLEGAGLTIISLNKIGSITTITLLKKDGIEEIINKFYSPSLLEQCPLDSSEIITLELLLAKKGDIHE